MTLRYLPIYFSILFGCLCFISCQDNLNSQFELIAQKHDMMGGSVVIFDKSKILKKMSIGYADIERGLKITEDTKYRIASISKTVTAIAVMQQVERRSLDLDQDISTILSFDVKNPYFKTKIITVRQLLNHTSTIVDGPTYSPFLQASVNENPVPSLDEILTDEGKYYSKENFIDHQPGTYFTYSNLNYAILGTIVEKITGQRFDSYCKKNISDPLAMDASFKVNDLSDIDQVAILYKKLDAAWTPQADNYEGKNPKEYNLGYIPGTNGARFGPQGGFRSSAKDLAKIFMMLSNGGNFDKISLLTENSCSSMLSEEWKDNGANGDHYHGLFRSWGLGIHRSTSSSLDDDVLSDTRMFGHPGEAYGLVSDAYFDPESQVGFVFITNGVGKGYHTNNKSAFYTIEQEIFEMINEYIHRLNLCH